MALGLYLPHALHVDCSKVMHERCPRQLGIRRGAYWPLVAADLGARPAERAWLQRALTTCSRGGMIKFLSPGHLGLRRCHPPTRGAGLPIVMQQSTLSNLHSTLDIVYDGALAWHTPDGLIGVLRSLDAGTLAAQARAARAHHESWHHPRELAYALANPRLTAPLPPLEGFVPDTLALYWR